MTLLRLLHISNCLSHTQSDRGASSTANRIFVSVLLLLLLLQFLTIKIVWKLEAQFIRLFITIQWSQYYHLLGLSSALTHFSSNNILSDPISSRCLPAPQDVYYDIVVLWVGCCSDLNAVVGSACGQRKKVINWTDYSLHYTSRLPGNYYNIPL